MSENSLKIAAHSFSFVSIDGTELPLSRFSNKVLLVINTASKCGFTRQYADMQKLWNAYKKKGLVVLGVPSNDFGGQEPGNETEIREFCEINFNVDFPLTQKVHIKGPNAHPFYKWASEKMGLVAKPRWNFHKYLIAGDGRLIDWFSSPTSPSSGKIIKAVEAALSDLSQK